MSDPIKHPKHYTSHPSGIECIAIVQHHNFNVGNAIKYLWRCGLKRGEEQRTALRKAREYIDFELSRLDAEQKVVPGSGIIPTSSSYGWSDDVDINVNRMMPP